MNRRISKRTKTGNAGYYTSTQYIYDSIGRILKEVHFDREGKEIYAYENEYDSVGLMTRIYFVNAEVTKLYEERIFDNQKRLIENNYWHERLSTEPYPPDPLDGKQKFAYNTDGSLSHTYFYQHGKLKEIRKMYYK